jgi:glycosyltransferase involved in cell wall biosynthesis
MVTDRIVKLYESCDEVWACSEETGETLRSYGYRKPYYVMPNGTDVSAPENPEEVKARAAAEYGIPPGKKVLLFVGQQIWYKNQKLILDTFRRLCDGSGDWLLIMVGTGKDEQAIERYAASLNLSEHVLFTGQIRDRTLLQGVYLNAGLLFFPSVFDNAPLVLREAAVLGVPTLAVEGSNAAGAIRKNVNGFIAAETPEAMSAEIERIFREEDIRKIGRNAQETIPLSWEKLAPMVEERYREVIQRVKSEERKE